MWLPWAFAKTTASNRHEEKLVPLKTQSSSTSFLMKQVEWRRNRDDDIRPEFHRESRLATDLLRREVPSVTCCAAEEALKDWFVLQPKSMWIKKESQLWSNKHVFGFRVFNLSLKGRFTHKQQTQSYIWWRLSGRIYGSEHFHSFH